jgi:hypothetical protein
MAKRASTGKSTRFEIFKRDHFTCQYCGSQPPAVVLVVDHIHPVCEGGSSDMDNLITSCETCNQGKAGKLLDQVPNRPDADLMYLEAQQEISELKRYQLAKLERDSTLIEIVSDLRDTWYSYLPDDFDWSPPDHVLRGMLAKYAPDIVEAGVVATAQALSYGRVSKRGDAYAQYMYGVMRNVAFQQTGKV